MYNAGIIIHVHFEIYTLLATSIVTIYAVNKQVAIYGLLGLKTIGGQMKKHIISAVIGAVCMLIILFVVAIIKNHSSEHQKAYIHIDFESDILSKDCYLCNNQTNSTAFNYWGEDNVGILNLNTLDLLPIEINRYKDGEKISDAPAGYMQQDEIRSGDSYANTNVFPDEGFARVQIIGVEYSINRAHLQANFCQVCLDSINEVRFSQTAPAEYAILDFSQKTIHPLSPSFPWFSVGSYGINCEFKEDTRIDLLIHLLRTSY